MKLDEKEFLDDELKEEKGNPKRTLTILLGALLVVLLLGVAIFFFFMTGNQERANGTYDERTQTEETMESSTSGQEESTAESGFITESMGATTSVESSALVESSTEAESTTSEESSTEVESTTSEELSTEVDSTAPDEPLESTVEPSEGPTDPYASMNFYAVEEEVTAKEATNLRDIPSQGGDSTVLTVLQNGEVAQRIAISDAGWSKLLYQGEEYYAVSSLLTTDLDYHVEVEVDDGIKTVFTPCNDKVSPKIEVNLRKLPSVTNENATVVVTLPYGEVVTRTGINTDLGWSRVEYNGEVLYCISSYVYVVE